jgi:phosphorylcholine metabolism protein LicD
MLLLIRIFNIVLAVIIIIWIIKTIEDSKHSFNKPFNSVWSVENYDETKKLIKDTQLHFTKSNIQFFVINGTLLGLIRHKGFIPWNDSLNISIDKEYFKQIVKDKKLFNDNGYDIYLSKHKNNITSIKIFYKDKKKVKNKNWSWPYIEIFGYYKESDKVVLEDQEEKFNFKNDDIFPLKTNLFEDIPLNIPNNSDNVLNKLYGKDWEEICYSSSYNHVYNRPNSKRYKVNCANIIQDENIEDIFEYAWVINLKRRPDRLKQSVNRLKKIGITPKIYTALDAKSEYVISDYKNIKHPHISLGEYACYLSHKTLWEYIYSLNIPYAIIFEDDIILEDNITKNDIINRIKGSKGFNILFLGHCFSNISNFRDPLTLVGTGLCLNAYIISRSAIQKLLEENKYDYLYPVDFKTKKFCQKELCYLSNTLSSKYYGDGIIKQENHYTNSDIKDRIFFVNN